MPGVMPWVKPSTPCGSRRKSNTCFNIHNSMTENAIEFFLCLQKHKKTARFFCGRSGRNFYQSLGSFSAMIFPSSSESSAAKQNFMVP